MPEIGKAHMKAVDPNEVWRNLLVQSATDLNLRIGLYRGDTQADVFSSGSDGISNNKNPLLAAAWKYAFNETDWDRWRGNTELTVLASGTRTTGGFSAEFTNYNARGIILYVNITNVAGTNPVLDINIKGIDPVSGNIRTVCYLDDLNSTGLYILIMYPGATESGTATFKGATVESGDLPLPRTWKLEYFIGGTNPSFTFSVGGAYVV